MSIFSGKLLPLLKKFRHQADAVRNLFLINSSGLFDKDWYLAKYPDVRSTNENPSRHYLLHGGFEGRDPGPEFKSAWYLNTYDDVKRSNINPLIHYLRYGKKEGRYPKAKSFLPDSANKLKIKGAQTNQKQITFFVSDLSEYQSIEPVAIEAKKRGYDAIFSRDFSQPAEIGVYSNHRPNPSNSRFSIVMLHQIGQDQWPECPSKEPNAWLQAPWNAFDIGILPGRASSQSWYSISQNAYSRPRLGVFELGNPKSDRIFKDSAVFNTEVSQLKNLLRMKNQPTVLYAPSHINENHQNDFINSLQSLPVNLLIKHYPWKDESNQARVHQIAMEHENLKDQGVYFVEPEVNIFACLALCDLVVSDESNCLVEALLFEIPGLSVSDWICPAIPDWFGEDLPPHTPDAPPCAIKTTRADLKGSVADILQTRDQLRPRLRQYRDYYYSHLGSGSVLTMDVLEAALKNTSWPIEPLLPKLSGFFD